MAGRKGRSLIGLPVVDSNGIELGYVSAEQDNILVLGDGSTGLLKLGRRYVDRIEDKVLLKGPIVEIFSGLNVVDNEGEFIGVVKDTVEAGDLLDSLIIEDESGELVTVLLEDVRSIDEWVELSVSGDSLGEG